jgi:hypothetical protein
MSLRLSIERPLIPCVSEIVISFAPPRLAPVRAAALRRQVSVAVRRPYNQRKGNLARVASRSVRRVQLFELRGEMPYMAARRTAMTPIRKKPAPSKKPASRQREFETQTLQGADRDAVIAAIERPSQPHAL